MMVRCLKATPANYGSMAISDIVSSLGGGLSGAASRDLFGGSQLRDQVAGETDEERKRRLKQQFQQQGPSFIFGSPAVQSLFGSTGAYGR